MSRVERSLGLRYIFRSHKYIDMIEIQALLRFPRREYLGRIKDKLLQNFENIQHLKIQKNLKKKKILGRTMYRVKRK